MEAVAVAGTLVSVGAGVFVGTGDSVTMNVEVADGRIPGVALGKVGMMVTPGVKVGTFGTHSTCPA
jgi:hypothetical protein